MKRKLYSAEPPPPPKSAKLVYFIGPPATGKTILACAVQDHLSAAGRAVTLVDDVCGLRHKSDRKRQLALISEEIAANDYVLVTSSDRYAVASLPLPHLVFTTSPGTILHKDAVIAAVLAFGSAD